MRYLGALMLLAGCLLAPFQVGAQDQAKPFSEGWERSVLMPGDLWGGAGRYVIWVEKGWLQVRRETASGEKDWHFVLASASDLEPPNIVAPVAPPQGEPRFEVSYRGGRFFVREDLSALCVLRERKPQGKGWPALKLDAGQKSQLGSAANRAQTVLGGLVDSWFIVTCGPTEGEQDCWLRLTPKELMNRGGGYGFESFDALARVFAGQNWVLDDGELLVAIRGCEQEVLGDLHVGEMAPPLMAKTLDGRPISLQEFRGKYVLLDFWATWCGPCVAELPTLQDVYAKFGQDEQFVLLSLSLDEEVEAPKNSSRSRESRGPRRSLVTDRGPGS